MGRWITLHAADGTKVSGYRADPVGTARGGLVVIQEIFGVNSHIRSVADGYAAEGYLAIAPAVFDRQQPRIELGYTPDDIARGRDLKANASLEHALADIAAARDVAAEAGKVGVVGYCWGGYLAWMAAARVPRLACAICYYGGGMTEAIGEKPRMPVLAHFGEKDSMIPVAGVRKLADAHPGAKVHLYAADHGFNCDQRGSHDATAAKLARERSIAFLREHVG
jgi:carboxymethylenebutenolidase